jgi:hypothetical protein
VGIRSTGGCRDQFAGRTVEWRVTGEWIAQNGQISEADYALFRATDFTHAREDVDSDVSATGALEVVLVGGGV